MDDLFKEVSVAQNARIIEELNEKKRQQDILNNLIQEEMDLAFKQIRFRKSKRIIIFELTFSVSDEIKLVVLNKIIETFKSTASICSLSYAGKWSSTEYYYHYDILESQLKTMPKKKNITIDKYAIEFNANSDKLFSEKSGFIGGKVIEHFEH